ncbi:MAG: hypothetical protein LH614_09960, partial [Pyrinomonadaceae bacterium]|nr:hypothetical protein [Pyrinomonadaceae bacterium]
MKRQTHIGFLMLLTMIAAVNVAEVNAQAAPTVRINLPERFRVITNQYFDLRVEAEGINRSTARVIVEAEADGVTESLNVAGATEITNDNDASPLTLDKAWTYRRVSFTTPGIKT